MTMAIDFSSAVRPNNVMKSFEFFLKIDCDLADSESCGTARSDVNMGRTSFSYSETSPLRMQNSTLIVLRCFKATQGKKYVLVAKIKHTFAGKTHFCFFEF